MQWIRRLAELTEDWYYIAQHAGWSSAMLAIMSKLLSLLYQRRQFIVMTRSLMTPLPDLQPNIDVEIRPFEPADLDLIQGFDLPSDVKLCSQRLKCGHRGVLALVQHNFAGYAWSYTAEQSALDHVRIELLSRDVLFLSDYTAPAFRGRGIQTALILTRFRMFIDLGYQRAFSCISPHNGPSLAAYRKVGGHEYGVIEDLRLGPWQRINFRRLDVLNS